MKDILIKGSRIKTELIYWSASFVIAIIFNVYAIIKYNTGWMELLSQLHIVLLLSVAIYLLISLLRGLIFITRFFIEKK